MPRTSSTSWHLTSYLPKTSPITSSCQRCNEIQSTCKTNKTDQLRARVQWMKTTEGSLCSLIETCFPSADLSSVLSLCQGRVRHPQGALQLQRAWAWCWWGQTFCSLRRFETNDYKHRAWLETLWLLYTYSMCTCQHVIIASQERSLEWVSCCLYEQQILIK